MNLYFRLLLTWLRGRLLPRLSPWDTHITPMRVLPNDLDLLGHMNNGRYPTVLDLGRIGQMLRSPVHREITREGGYFVVAALTVNYRRSLMPWQRYEIHTRFLSATAHATFVEQTFVGVGEHEGEVFAHAMVRMRALKRSGGGLDDAAMSRIFGPAPDNRTLPAWVEEWSTATRHAARDAGRDAGE